MELCQKQLKKKNAEHLLWYVDDNGQESRNAPYMNVDAVHINFVVQQINTTTSNNNNSKTNCEMELNANCSSKLSSTMCV